MATTSRSSASERMRSTLERTQTAAYQPTGGRSRGQTSPATALVAVAMVCLAVSLYATVLGGAEPTTERNVATPTIERVHDVLAPAGVAAPTRLDDAAATAPTGYAVNVTLLADGGRWAVGPEAPRTESRATRRVAVRSERTSVVPGRLRVAVWR